MRSSFLLFVIMMIASCGPLYQTDYLYSPPKSSGGKACIYQCEVAKNQCAELEELKAQRCQDYSDREREYCEDDIAIRKGRDTKWYECIPDSCNVDSERCETTYRSCYQSCGGKVDAVTRCVANCDKIPPAQK